MGMMDSRPGHSGSKAAAMEIAEYQEDEALTVDTEAEMARYYGDEVAPEDTSAVAQAGKAVHAGEVSFEDALAGLVADEEATEAKDLAERQEQNAAHFVGWIENGGTPDLDKLAEYVAGSDACMSVTDVGMLLADDLDVAIAAAENRDAGAVPLTPEARALHGLPEPPKVAEYLRDQPLSALREQRETIVERWDAAWLAADYRADVRETAAAERPDRLSGALADAVGRAKMREELLQGGRTVARLRDDMSPAMAELMGFDRSRPVTKDEMANIFQGLRADGKPIEGKQIQSARLSVAEIFGITDLKTPPTGEPLENILAGKRVDGQVPYAKIGSFAKRKNDQYASDAVPPEGHELIPQRLIDGGIKRFLAAVYVPPGRKVTEAMLTRIRAGEAATEGLVVNPGEYGSAIAAKKQPISYIATILSMDKSGSIAWGLAPTEAEKTLLHQIHVSAVAQAMAYVETQVGMMRKGKEGRLGTEKGEIPWIVYNHYTSRPVAEIAVKDANGQEYTAFSSVPSRHPDMHLHSHIMVPSVVLTESGRVGSIDTDRWFGMQKTFGAVYQGFVAAEARKLGIRIGLGPSGEARFLDVPNEVRSLFSKRSQGAKAAAMAYAAEQGEEWDKLAPEQQLALLKKGVRETRRAKRQGASDFAEWRKEAKEALGYEHRSVLRPGEVKPEPSPAERREAAYKASQTWVEGAFVKRAVIDTKELLEAAARGLIVGGIKDPVDDLAAVMSAYRRYGIRQNGEQTSLLWGQGAKVRGKERWTVTTDLHISQERDLIELAQKAAADKSAALAPEQVERAVAAFLKRSQKIDPASDQWKAQRAMIDALGIGGRLGVGIGAAGAGKGEALKPLVDAWKEDGRSVYGIAIANRTASALADIGIAAANRASIAAFTKRIENGRYALDRNSVVVIDEVSLVGTRQFLKLLQLREKHGFQIVAIGDTRQCQAVEAGPVLALIEKAMPGAITEIVASIRQKTERERETAKLFRDGNAADAIAMKRADGSAILVAGGKEATIDRVAKLWAERMEANKDDPNFTLSVSAATREDARLVSVAIRRELQSAGKVGPDLIVVQAANNAGEKYEMPIGVGDRIMSLRNLNVARRDVIAVNGTLMTVTGADKDYISIRTDAGREGRLPWKALSDGGGPMRIAPGYAATVDSQQGLTSDEHIHALVSGSGSAHAFQTYVAQSRHRHGAYLVVNEAAERRSITHRQPIGAAMGLKQNDIWQHVGENLSRVPTKATATDFLKSAAKIMRGTVSHHFRARVSGEQRAAQEATGGISVHDRMVRKAAAPEVDSLAAYARKVAVQAGQIAQRQMEQASPRPRM
jgi:hypothetical protein